MNWHDIQLLDRVRDGLESLGYTMKLSRYGYNDNSIGIYPKDCLRPIYSRDAQLFSGTIEQIHCWMLGVQREREYLTMLKATTEKKIQQLEEKYIKKIQHDAMVKKINDPDIKLDEDTKVMINQDFDYS